MEPPTLEALARAAEEKLAKSQPLSREERTALLVRLLATQETRRDRKYGLR